MGHPRKQRSASNPHRKEPSGHEEATSIDRWLHSEFLPLSRGIDGVNASTVAVASAVAAAVSIGVPTGAGFAAVVFAVFHDVMTLRNVAFAVRAGAFGVGRSAHGSNT